MTKLFQHTAAAFAALLIVAATFGPVVAVPQSAAASTTALPLIA